MTIENGTAIVLAYVLASAVADTAEKPAARITLRQGRWCITRPGEAITAAATDVH